MNNCYSDFKIIAEIGCNHEGNFEKAVELMHLAIDAGADIVKFQSYTPEKFVSADDKARYERVTKFSLTLDEFYSLSEIAIQRNVQFMSTPITEDWVEYLNPICSAFKIASGDITFQSVIQLAAKTQKPILLSTGGATLDEIDQAIEWITTIIAPVILKERLTLMHCVSAYPTPIDEANILSIPFLRERYQLGVGYSNHVIGMHACIAAVAHGASIIEVHFTDKKEAREFRDHALSFDYDDLKKFIGISKEIRNCLGRYGKEVQNCERSNVPLIRKGVVAASDIKAGDILTEEQLMFSRPATEFPASQMQLLIGKQVNCDIRRGCIIPRDSIICVE